MRTVYMGVDSAQEMDSIRDDEAPHLPSLQVSLLGRAEEGEEDEMIHRNCKWFEAHRNPDTGRVCPSQAGKCTWPVPWPEKWPLAFWNRDWSSRIVPPRPPVSTGIWGSGKSENCPCFERKAK